MSTIPANLEFSNFGSWDGQMHAVQDVTSLDQEEAEQDDDCLSDNNSETTNDDADMEYDSDINKAEGNIDLNSVIIEALSILLVKSEKQQDNESLRNKNYSDLVPATAINRRRDFTEQAKTTHAIDAHEPVPHLRYQELDVSKCSPPVLDEKLSPGERYASGESVFCVDFAKLTIQRLSPPQGPEAHGQDSIPLFVSLEEPKESLRGVFTMMNLDTEHH